VRNDGDEAAAGQAAPLEERQVGEAERGGDAPAEEEEDPVLPVPEQDMVRGRACLGVGEPVALHRRVPRPRRQEVRHVGPLGDGYARQVRKATAAHPV